MIKLRFLLTPFFFLFLGQLSAQDLSGLWQGVSYITTTSNYYVITMNLQQNGTIATGTALTKEANGANYAVQTVRGMVSNNNFNFSDQERIDSNNTGAYNWCMRFGILKYNAALEKLAGETQTTNCGTRIISIEMYRLKIFADTFTCIQRTMTLRATGLNLRWYKDANKQFLVDTGGVINPFISSDTTFYVTQTLYNTESPVVPIKIRYKNPANLNQSFTICEGQSIAVGDTVYRTSGIYTKRFVTTGGCDSLVITKLTVKIPPKIQKTFNLCAGESVSVGDTTYKTTGVYIKKFKTTEGCDSTITTNLTVKDKIVFNQILKLCEGEKVTVGDTIYRTTGIYTKRLIAKDGCDSLVTTNLTIKPVQKISRDLKICEGEALTVGDTTYKTSGIYVKKLKTTEGCDSVITTNLTVSPSPKKTQTITICEGETVTISDTAYKTSGVYIKKYKTSNGCDSTMTTTVVVNPIKKTNQDVRLCRGTSLIVGDTIYKTEGTYVKKLRNFTGCDSVVTTNLKIANEVTFAQKLKICDGTTISVGDTTYRTTGIYTKKLRATEGCDSIVTTDLTVVKLDLAFSRDTILRLGDSILLKASISLPLFITWKWTPNTYLKCDTCATTWVKPKISTIYQVEVFDQDSKCRKTGKVFIKTKTDCNIFVPTAFSPNDDKVNDMWAIYPSDCVKQIKRIVLFNRWGDQILIKNNITITSTQGLDIWDGVVNGKQIETGVFVYVIEAEYINGESVVIGGDFSIIR
jgi:gliding motility-associated-like protein